MSLPEVSVAPSQVAQIVQAAWKLNETEPMRIEGIYSISSVTLLLRQHEPTLLAYLDQRLKEVFSEDYARVLAYASNTRPIDTYSITVVHEILPRDESCGTQDLSGNPPSKDSLLQEWVDDQGKPWSFGLSRIRATGLNNLSSAMVAYADEQIVIPL